MHICFDASIKTRHDARLVLATMLQNPAAMPLS
jgi:hypothetical protein